MHLIADAFSRRPVDKPTEEDNDIYAARQITACDAPLREVIYQAAEDEDYKEILDRIDRRHHPNQTPPDSPTRALTSIWDKLSISEDYKLIIYDSSKLFIPANARPSVLKFLHTSHCGYVKTKRLAQELYFWPNMNAEIKTLTENCAACRELQPT